MTAECEELLPPWLKSDDLQVRTPMKLPRIPQPPALPNTSWMLILEERRRATEERLGPKADYPKPRTKLRGRSPRVPKEDSEDWSREASTLDRRTLARLLGDLKDRLARERKMTSATEAKLAKLATRTGNSGNSESRLERAAVAAISASAPALQPRSSKGPESGHGSTRSSHT
ncbi:unnamed protein product [Cladocopium goreaui]|uniref:Uncharacterized protein n=1 Tax=Cladocopium goreaui TaxID=2562237 RepID=A0A9P1FL33_9DINO|nr:unnamed protein product [Cladocopium goreaui]